MGRNAFPETTTNDGNDNIQPYTDLYATPQWKHMTSYYTTYLGPEFDGLYTSIGYSAEYDKGLGLSQSSNLSDDLDNRVPNADGGNGVVWAYNVFPNDTINNPVFLPSYDQKNADYVPRIVLRLDQVEVKDGATLMYRNPNEPWYVTVNGYSIPEGERATGYYADPVNYDEAANRITNFRRGYVYRIESLEFSYDDMELTPGKKAIQANVSAELIPWKLQAVNPSFDTY
jgi:hypothetical protein